MDKDKSILERFTDTVKEMANSASEALKGEEPPRVEQTSAGYMPFAAEGLGSDPLLVPPLAMVPPRKQTARKRAKAPARKSSARKAAKPSSARKAAAKRAAPKKPRKAAKTSARGGSRITSRSAARTSAKRTSKATTRRTAKASARKRGRR